MKEKILKAIKDMHPNCDYLNVNCRYGCCQECTTCETLDKVIEIIEELE